MASHLRVNSKVTSMAFKALYWSSPWADVVQLSGYAYVSSTLCMSEWWAVRTCTTILRARHHISNFISHHWLDPFLSSQLGLLAHLQICRRRPLHLLFPPPCMFFPRVSAGFGPSPASGVFPWPPCKKYYPKLHLFSVSPILFFLDFFSTTCYLLIYCPVSSH